MMPYYLSWADQINLFCPNTNTNTHTYSHDTTPTSSPNLHCDVTKCTATAYKTCSGGDLCGTKNGISCAHVPTGLGNTGCAEDPLAPVQEHDNWVTFEGLVEGDQIAG